jgi:hypothetical protein
MKLGDGGKRTTVKTDPFVISGLAPMTLRTMDHAPAVVTQGRRFVRRTANKRHLLRQS